MAEPRALFSVTGPDLPSDQFTAGKGTFTIGRVAGNNLPLNNQKVSRHHADITWENDHYTIEDLESSNGTLLNDARLEPRQPAVLKVGDVIRIGPFALTLVSIDMGENAPPPTPVQVLSPEPNAPPMPAAPPPTGSPSAEEAPAPFVNQAPSFPPAEPHAAATVEPIQTLPPGENEPTAATPKVEKAKAVKPKPADVALSIPPTHKPGTNGRRGAPPPYVPIEGVPLDESRYMQFLPGVYDESAFLKRYLLIMESILAPLEWGVDSFEQYYNPNLTTPDWLQWIASWFDVFLHPSVPVDRQRAVVRELAQLYRSRGTRKCLRRIMELYFGVAPEIIELEEPPSSFVVKLPLAKKENTTLNRALAERLIETLKPAYTKFTLETE